MLIGSCLVFTSVLEIATSHWLLNDCHRQSYLSKSLRYAPRNDMVIDARLRRLYYCKSVMFEHQKNRKALHAFLFN